MGDGRDGRRNRSGWWLAAALALACTPAASQTRTSPTAPRLTAAGAPVTAPQPGGIDWKAAMVGQRQTYGQGPKLTADLGLAQDAVDRTRLPILLPQGPPFAKARIYSFGDYYSISADVAGAGWSLTGTTAKIDLPAATPLRAQPGPEGLVIQRTVDGQLASFVRYGVLYTVELRCDEPGDARCRSDAAVRDLLARTTVVVMGKAARRAAGMGG